MIVFCWNIRWPLLFFIFKQLNLQYVTVATWPAPSSASSIQLLGLFQDTANISELSEWSVHSRAMFIAAILLSHQYNITIDGQFLQWQAAQTDGSAIQALRSTCQALSTSNIAGIVGPGLSSEAHVVASFAETIGIPVISYAATDPGLSDRNKYPTFYRTIPSDSIAASAIIKLFVRFNWTSCVIIYQNDLFGSGGAKAISKAFIDNKWVVRDMIVFDIATRRIQGDLKTYLINSATRIVVVWAQSIYTSLILQKALEYDILGPHFTWILRSSISLTSSVNQTFYPELIGMLELEPVIGTAVDVSVNKTLLNAAYDLWQQYEPETFPRSTKVSQYALFAFDATWTLIQSLRQFCSTNTNSSSSCLTFIASSFCFDYRFFQSKSLFDTIHNMAFLGVSGPIKFLANQTDRSSGSYYSILNSQPSLEGISFMPVLTYSDPDDWMTYTDANVIVWPGNSFVTPIDRSSLSGIYLRIGVLESPPFTMITNVINEFGQNSTKLSGYGPDLIALLKNKMGFTPNIRLASSNQTYSNLVQAVVDGVYDMVIGDVTITARRREMVDFSVSIFDTSFSLIMRKEPDVSVDLVSFLKPFSRNLWLLILVVTIDAGILICFLEREENEVLQNRSVISLCAMTTWYSFGTLVGYGADFSVQTGAGRLLTVGLYILSLVLAATYTANLASDLTILKAKNSISGIEDIKKEKIPFHRIGVRVGTAGEQYFLREISGGNRNYFPLKSQRDIYDSLLSGIIDASLLDTAVGEYITNNIYCNLTLIGESFQKSMFGIVMPKQWLYAEDFDMNILLLRESGDLDNLRKEWYQTKHCPDSSVTSTAMGIESLGGLFLVFGLISILSILLFMWKKRCILRQLLSTLIHRNNTSAGK